MRERAKSGALQVRAISGLHVVTLAWDFLPGRDTKRDGLMGFALERAELTTEAAQGKQGFRGCAESRCRHRHPLRQVY